jgi:hypothetical protein
MSSNSEPRSRLFGRYREALKAISSRTHTPLPSLLVSFAVLHELTAIVPFVGIFFGARALGIGELVVTKVTKFNENPGNEWTREKLRQLAKEGENWTERIRRKYGVFGVAGDVANAMVAYGITKVRE